MTSPLTAYRYADGSIGYPGHPIGPYGSEHVETIDLSEYSATVVTWTSSQYPPPGVRKPNPVAIVEFEVEGESVRAIGQLSTDDIAIGDRVRPEYVEELRDPERSMKVPDSQAWDGYRFVPVDE